MPKIPVDEAPVGSIRYFIGQEEVDLPPGTQFKMGPKGETYIVLPPYTYIGGPGEGAKIYLEDDTWLMLQSGTVFENVTVMKGKGDDEDTD